MKLTLLLATPLTVTATGPVVAVAGAGAVMLVALQLLGVAATALKVTLLVPCVEPKLAPVIVTGVPTGPKVEDRFAILGGIIVHRKAEAVPPRFCNRRPLLCTNGAFALCVSGAVVER